MTAQAGSAARQQERDFYRILQVHPDADSELVDRAYWRLAHVYNTAIRTDPLAKDRLDELNEAYAVLGSPTRRRDYDRARGIVRRDSDWVREALRRERRPRGLLWWGRRRAKPSAPAQRQQPLLPPERHRLPSLENQLPDLPEIEYPKFEPLRRAEEPAPAPAPAPAPSPLEPRAASVLSTQRPVAQESGPRLVKAGLSLPWRVVASTVSVLALASAVLITGEQPIMVLALLVVAVTFTASSFLPALRLRMQTVSLRSREAARPANLGDATIPGGSAQGVRKLVYQIYDQHPQLGPGDVQAVARYALLTQRFVRVERKLARTYADSNAEWWRLAAEQRTLAAELRRHEVALGLTKSAPAAGAQERPDEAPTAKLPSPLG